MISEPVRGSRSGSGSDNGGRISHNGGSRKNGSSDQVRPIVSHIVPEVNETAANQTSIEHVNTGMYDSNYVNDVNCLKFTHADVCDEIANWKMSVV